MRQIAGIGIAPARADPLRHAHGVDHLRVAARALGDAVADERCADGRLRGLLGQHLGQQRDHHEKACTAQGATPSQGWKAKQMNR